MEIQRDQSRSSTEKANGRLYGALGVLPLHPMNSLNKIRGFKTKATPINRQVWGVGPIETPSF